MSQKISVLIFVACVTVACGKPVDNKDAGTWPPATWWTATTCELPTCNASASAVPFDSSGNFQITLTTKTSDCNATI